MRLLATESGCVEGEGARQLQEGGRRTNTAEQSSASKQACTKHGVTLAELNAYMLQCCAPTALHSETSSPSNCVLRLLPELDSSRAAPTFVSARPTCVRGRRVRVVRV